MTVKLIELTCYDTRKPLYLDPQQIKAVIPLEAYQCDVTGTENSERTRIDYGRSQVVLVVEEPSEIMAKINTISAVR